MNSQELRNLQEAYSQVYQLDEMFRLGKKKGTSPRADAIINSPEFKKRMEDADKIAIQNLRDMMSGDKKRQNRVTMHPDNRTDLNYYKEQVDLYDIILSHLLDEGYADTQEAAEAIMVNMSEDWRESICEGLRILHRGRMSDKAASKRLKAVGTKLKSKFTTAKGTTERNVEDAKAAKLSSQANKIDQVAAKHIPIDAEGKEIKNRGGSYNPRNPMGSNEYAERQFAKNRAMLGMK